MGTVTVSLPDEMTDWIEIQVDTGAYPTASEYLQALVLRDRAKRDRPQYTLEDLRRIVDDARAGGDSSRSISDIFDEGDRIARAAGYLRE